MIIVGIGEYHISNKPGEVIKTMALGSCVGIMIYAPKLKTAAMAHVALPDSSIGADKAKILPAYFADSAIPLLVKEYQKLGVSRPSELIIKLAGGASIMDPNGTFNIGKRNVLAIRKILWKHRLGARREDVGKDFSRTVTMEIDTGRVIISSPGKGKWEL